MVAIDLALLYQNANLLNPSASNQNTNMPISLACAAPLWKTGGSGDSNAPILYYWNTIKIVVVLLSYTVVFALMIFASCRSHGS